jgi:catechol 2,3-dioxygenase-like lactoylglutathione lyase family enzyme
MPHLAHIALIVRDYDEALAFYVGKLGFTLVEDTYQPDQDKRWVTIRPPGAPAHATTILLARAATDEQARFVGNQSGGRVFLFLATDDFDRDHTAFTAAGVEWVRPPLVQSYGKVAVFTDLYGNLWDLIEFAPASSANLLHSPHPHGVAAMEVDASHPLTAPQSARATLRFGDRFVMETDARATPLGLLAIGGLVAAILLSVPPIVRAKRAARALPPPRS